MEREDWDWVNEGDGWVPPTVDYTRPSIARVYDYGLGGKDNYPVDREAAEAFAKIMPDARLAARANRDFLTEVVRSMAESGIRQFLDLGTGIPTPPNVHETARAIQPDAKIVYVDNDPIVLAHNRALMRAADWALVLSHDLRQPAVILDDPRLRRLLDLSQPVGVLMIAVMHFVPAASGPLIVARYLSDLAPGSRLAISALSSHGVDPAVLRETEAAQTSTGAAPLTYRTEAELLALFDGMEMVMPLADIYRSQTAAVLGGVGVKP